VHSPPISIRIVCYNTDNDEKRLAVKMGGIFRKQRSRLQLAVITACAILMLPATVAANTLISQDFTSDQPIPAGSIVSLQKNSSDSIDVATLASSSNILGVAIGSNSSQVSLTSTYKNQVQVATSGVEQVLISDMNGNIAVGDAIAASPVNGVGMKATSNTKVVGIAQDSFPNTTSTKQSYSDKSGQKHSINLGQVPALINVTYFYKQPDKTLIPSAVQNIANALAGKSVSSLPILISIGIFIVSLIVVVSIIYALIRSSIISVGRNPMSQAAVYRNVIQLSTLVIIILAVASFAIYLILTRL
jgi:hypothetical protein